MRWREKAPPEAVAALRGGNAEAQQHCRAALLGSESSLVRHAPMLSGCPPCSGPISSNGVICFVLRLYRYVR